MNDMLLSAKSPGEPADRPVNKWEIEAATREDNCKKTSPDIRAEACEEPSEEASQPNFVAFRISGQDFCVDILAVREISQRTHVTPLPRSPDYISGVINLRGAVVPVLDGCIRFGLEAPARQPSRQVIIVVQTGERTLGILVDEVTEILNIPHSAIKAVPDNDGAATPPLVSGVIVLETNIIRVIDLAQVVPEKELATT